MKVSIRCLFLIIDISKSGENMSNIFKEYAFYAYNFQNLNLFESRVLRFEKLDK